MRMRVMKIMKTHLEIVKQRQRNDRYNLCKQRKQKKILKKKIQATGSPKQIVVHYVQGRHACHFDEINSVV